MTGGDGKEWDDDAPERAHVCVSHILHANSTLDSLMQPYMQ